MAAVTMGLGARTNKKPNRDITYQHTYTGLIPGDVAVAVENAIKALGFAYEETTTLIHNPYSHGGPEEIPFVRHHTTNDIEIPYGTFSIEDLGDVTMRFESHAAPPVMHLTAQLANKNLKSQWEKLVAAVDELAKQKSLFKGKAVNIHTPQDLLVPSYMDLSAVNELFFNSKLTEEIENSIFWPLRNRKVLVEEKIGTKFGVLLEGYYGVGKSEIAYKAAQVAIEHGWGVLHMQPYMVRVAIKVATILQPVLIEVEDIDMSINGDRDNLTTLLNSFSSMTTKANQDYALIATTNFADRIDPAMLRPDRIDRLIPVELPDQETADRIIKHYCGSHLSNDVNGVAKEFVNITPAIIMETAKRAKIHALRTGNRITADTLLFYKERMARQIELAKPVYVEDSHADRLYSELQHVTGGN